MALLRDWDQPATSKEAETLGKPIFILLCFVPQLGILIHLQFKTWSCRVYRINHTSRAILLNFGVIQLKVCIHIQFGHLMLNNVALLPHTYFNPNLQEITLGNFGDDSSQGGM